MINLKQYKVIEITGLEAEKYLQGQLTCDVEKLENGQQTLTAHCDPKGKMSALLRLYRESAEKFIAIIHQSLLPLALDNLKKYAVFSKVEFVEKETHVYGTASGEIFAKFCKEKTACKIEEVQPRYLILSDETLESVENHEFWDVLDIQNGVPILLKENQLQFIPQALNLQLIEQAISFTKGCYIGQESVARAKYRGANKRAMFGLSGEISENFANIEIGSKIEMQVGENWKSTGTVLQAVSDENKLWVQVVLNKEIETNTQFRMNGVALSILPLPYQLEEV